MSELEIGFILTFVFLVIVLVCWMNEKDKTATLETKLYLNRSSLRRAENTIESKQQTIKNMGVREEELAQTIYKRDQYIDHLSGHLKNVMVENDLPKNP